jgi:arabinogalactan endo-1,4-beta-galactosidase
LVAGVSSGLGCNGSAGSTGAGTGGAPGSGAGGATGVAGASGSGGASGGAGSSGTGGASSSGGTTGTGGITGAGTGGSGGTVTGTGGATGAGGSLTGGGGAMTIGASYFIGADVTDQETQPAATRANLLTLMKAHGFNYVRLRTFVDPKAADGYDKTNGFDDIAHTVAFGKQVKDAGMGFLLDFHYSDNWADPGKQCVPVAWQSITTIAGMATAVHDYTKDAITQLVAGGARPDMVQIGNEETPGLLIHLCDSRGLPLAGIAGYNAVNGALYLYSSTDKGAPPAGGPPAGGWNNLGMLLNAAAAGIKEVDTGIKIVIHLDRGNDLASSRNYIMNATAKAVPFDVFAESCYVNVQGQPADWQTTFSALSTQFPNVKLMISEYGTQQRAANDIIFQLPNLQGIGTFNWQPTDLWTRAGANYTAQTDMAIYDQMKTDYAGRL